MSSSLGDLTNLLRLSHENFKGLKRNKRKWENKMKERIEQKKNMAERMSKKKKKKKKERKK